MDMDSCRSSELPPELISEILLKLPVKALLRFRCVSKSWCPLINSQRFINMHLQHSIQASNTSLQHLILTHTIRCSSLEFCSGHVDQVLDQLETKLDNPFKSCKFRTEIVASCNGLLLVYHHCSLALWNPFTRKCKKLPHPIPQSLSRNCETYYGFGHDHVNNDYKVVCIMDPMMTDPGIASEVHVYSLGLNSWRRVQDFPYSSYFMTSPGGIFLNGALHWLITLTDTHDRFEYKLLLVAFDLVVEQFCVLPHPEAAKTNFTAFEVLEGCLCLLLPSRFGQEVWMMKQYGVGESWTKLYHIKNDYWVIGLRTLKPLLYSKNGEKILILIHDESNLEYNLGWYDLKEHTYIVRRFWDSLTSDLEVQLLRDIQLHWCIESLVSLGADSEFVTEGK